MRRLPTRLIQCVLAAIAASALIGALAQAAPAHVTTRNSEGQAFLFNRGDACFGLVPTHVLSGDDYAILTVPPISDVIAPTSAQGDRCYSWPEIDVSLLHVSGLGRAECGSVFATAAPIRELAQPNAIGTLLRANRNGSRTSKQVVVTFVGASRTALIRALRDDETLRQGDSGATLYLQNLPAAILREVSVESGEGSVTSFSEISSKLDDAGLACGWVRERKDVPAPISAENREDWSVSSWSHPPLGPEYRPENLVAHYDGDRYWAVDLAGDSKAWVELTSGNSAVLLVHKIEIQLTPAPLDSWPFAVEGFTCTSKGAGCVPAPATRSGNRFSITFGAPRIANRVRLELFTAPHRSSIAIGRVKIE